MDVGGYTDYTDKQHIVTNAVLAACLCAIESYSTH